MAYRQYLGSTLRYDFNLGPTASGGLFCGGIFKGLLCTVVFSVGFYRFFDAFRGHLVTFSPSTLCQTVWLRQSFGLFGVVGLMVSFKCLLSKAGVPFIGPTRNVVVAVGAAQYVE